MEPLERQKGTAATCLFITELQIEKLRRCGVENPIRLLDHARVAQPPIVTEPKTFPSSPTNNFVPSFRGVVPIVRTSVAIAGERPA